MAFALAKVLISLVSLEITLDLRISTSRTRLSTLEARASILSNFSSTDLLKAVCLLMKSLSKNSSSEGAPYCCCRNSHKNYHNHCYCLRDMVYNCCYQNYSYTDYY